MLNDKELVLTIDPADVSRLVSFPGVADRVQGRPYTRSMIDIVYDTEDRELRSRGVTLTVRKAGRRFVQRVLVESEGAPTREWENPIPNEDPVLAAIADPNLRRLATPGPGGALKAIQRTALKCTTHRIGAEEGTELALRVDRGAIATADSSTPISEVRLEQRAGEPGLLYDFALEMRHSVPIRVRTRSREDRARDILERVHPPWRKSGRLVLSPESTVEEALAQICAHCLGHLTDNEACTLESDHPEGIHQMRVATRRLRSALRLFRGVLPAEGYAWLSSEVRWLTGEMADARDLDVFMDEIVAPVAKAFPAEPGFAALLASVRTERDRAREAARAALASDRYTEFLLRYGAWIVRREWRLQTVSEASAVLFRPITELADALLTRRHRKARKIGRKFDSLTVEERHQLRIELKKLRYATDFFSSLYRPKRVTPFIARLQKLQDGLGYLNDVAVANGLVARFEGLMDTSAEMTRVGALVRGWHARGAADATRSLADDVVALFDEKPFWSKPRTGGETP